VSASYGGILDATIGTPTVITSSTGTLLASDLHQQAGTHMELHYVIERNVSR
jgi:hypothetical protein